MNPSSPVIASEMKLDNHLGRRFIAYILDALILGFAIGLMGGLIPDQIQPIVTIAAWLAYDTLMTSSQGKTLGKMILGLKVGDARSGKLPEQVQALKRSAIKAIPFVGLFLLVQMLLGKLPLHDEIADTRVTLA
jgi:uncharacterized RDD family membrane protein YckC